MSNDESVQFKIGQTVWWKANGYGYYDKRIPAEFLSMSKGGKRARICFIEKHWRTKQDIGPAYRWVTLSMLEARHV